MEEIVPNDKAAIEFLQKWNPVGPWVLTSISTDRKGIETATFRPETLVDLKRWLKLYNGDRNIYFSVNTPNRDLKK